MFYGPSPQVLALASWDSTLYVGGYFSDIGGRPQSYFAQFDSIGDINDDGQVNAVDVQLIINKALGLVIIGDADVNGDGEVNAADVQLVINAALGIL